jgi:ATP-dependent DNA helicase RecQ
MASARERLHDWQTKAMDAVRAGRDALVVVATGSGKSRVYQELALVGPVVVVMPLIALIADQMRHATAKGLRCAASAATDGCDPHAVGLSLRLDALADAQLVFITPEALDGAKGSDLLATLLRMRPIAFVVDEAHLVLAWANFRVAYSRLGSALASGRPRVPVLALTGTLTVTDEPALVASLCMVAPYRDRGSLQRLNIAFRVLVKKRNSGQQLFELVEQHAGQELSTVLPARRRSPSPHICDCAASFPPRTMHRCRSPNAP